MLACKVLSDAANHAVFSLSAQHAQDMQETMWSNAAQCVALPGFRALGMGMLAAADMQQQELMAQRLAWVLGGMLPLQAQGKHAPVPVLCASWVLSSADLRARLLQLLRAQAYSSLLDWLMLAVVRAVCMADLHQDVQRMLQRFLGSEEMQAAVMGMLAREAGNRQVGVLLMADTCHVHPV